MNSTGYNDHQLWSGCWFQTFFLSVAILAQGLPGITQGFRAREWVLEHSCSWYYQVLVEVGLYLNPLSGVRFVSSHEFRIVLASLYFVVCIIARYPSFSWRWRSSRRGSAGGKAKVLLIDPISRDPSYCTHFGRSGRHTADVGGSLCYGRDRNHSRGDWIPSSSSDNKLGHVGHSIIGLCDKSAWVVGHPPGVSPSSLLRSRFRGQRSLVHQ